MTKSNRKQGSLPLRDDSPEANWRRRVDDEESDCFHEGELARKHGLSTDENPYPPRTKERCQWLSGWIDEDSWMRVGHVFNNLGILWAASMDDLKEVGQ